MCLFCEIAQGERPAHFVLEDEYAVAFLDSRPLFEGHTLLIPRDHIETITDLPDPAVEPYFLRLRLLAGAVQGAMGAEGTFVAMNNKVSQSVPHLHTHVVPRRRKDGLRGFFWPRTRYESEARMAETAASIRKVVDG